MRNWETYVRGRLRLPHHSPAREARIVRELAAQLEDFYREARASGAGHAEADAYACRQIADWDRMAHDLARADRAHARPCVDRVADTIDRTDGRSRQMFANFLRDIRHGTRQLVESPGFAVVAILTLALGIGATSAIFSVVNGVLLRPLPYPEPDSLVRVYEVVPQYGRFAVAPASYLDWREQNTVFERLAAYSSSSGTFTGGDGPERIQGHTVSWDLFDLLKVAPVVGRGFTREEGTPGRNAVVMLSYGLWQRRFGGERSVLDRTITLNGVPATIVGVMPRDFYFPSPAGEFWTPLAFNPATASRGGHFLGVIARLKPGVPLQQAGAEIKAIAERLAVQYPESSANESAEIVALHEQVVGGVRPALLTLLAAVAIVVLIACANVANLLLVRASAREKEIAIRAALGAGGGRLVMQMLAESVVLAVSGGALGLLLAYLAIQPVRTLGAGSIPRVADVAIDGYVLGFAALVSIATGLMFGLAPAWHASRARLGQVLKEGGRTSAGSGGRWIRSGLLVVEVALSIVLLVGATLLLRSFARLTSIDPGFQAERIFAFQIALPQVAYPEPHLRVTFFTKLLDKLEALPQVTAAGMTQSLPLRGGYVLSFTVDRRPPPRPGEGASANYRSVSPKYFEALGVPLLRGRVFTDRDSEHAPRVAVVDEAFVDRHFPGEDPLGRGIDIGNGTEGFYEIVGVVGNVRYETLDAVADPTMYVAYAQNVFSSMGVVARTQGDPAQLSAAVRQVVRELDPSLPAYAMGAFTETVSGALADRRFSMMLLALFALIALFLAAVGLYGVVAYTVSQRTQEIGVRMAVGARPGDVLRLVVGGGLRLAAAGVVIGLAGALALARFIETMLYGVAAFDPASYVATAALLLAVSALACYLPARRAMRVDPVIALRRA